MSASRLIAPPPALGHVTLPPGALQQAQVRLRPGDLPPGLRGTLLQRNQRNLCSLLHLGAPPPKSVCKPHGWGQPLAAGSPGAVALVEAAPVVSN